MNKVEKEYEKMRKKLVGTGQTLGGGLFSGNKNLKPEKYKVLDIRPGTSRIINFKQFRETGKTDYEYATFKLLVKNKKMKRSRWTGPFALRGVNLAKTKYAQVT